MRRAQSDAPPILGPTLKRISTGFCAQLTGILRDTVTSNSGLEKRFYGFSIT